MMNRPGIETILLCIFKRVKFILKKYLARFILYLPDKNLHGEKTIGTFFLKSWESIS